MPKPEAYGYSSVEEDEDEAFLGPSELERAQSVPSARLARLSILLYPAVAIASFLIGVATGYNLSPNPAVKGLVFADTSQFRLYDGVTFESHEQRFNGSLFRRSAYSGPPSPDMDQAWARFTEAGSKSMPEYPPILNISSDDARASTRYPLETVVRLREAQNLGYMASLGFFHQIHCLNMLRRFIYLEYYERTQPVWYQQPLRRAHADHCVDMLRETLMCHGDTTLIVYHWIEGYNDPVPDFSTMHTCRNPEAILDWMQENQIELKDEVTKHGEIGLPEIF